MSFCSIGRAALTYFEKLNAQIVEIMKRTHGRPIYLGFIANEIGWSLDRTREFLLALPQPIRRLSIAECELLDVPCPAVAEMYVMKRD